jgi:hypothetical protein
VVVFDDERPLALAAVRLSRQPSAGPSNESARDLVQHV